MTFFQKNILRSFFAASGSPVHGESNDTLFASNRSKLVEKLSSEKAYVEKTLSTGARIVNKMNFEIDLLYLPIDFKNSFCAQKVLSASILLFLERKLHKKFLIGKSEKSSSMFFFYFTLNEIFVKTAKFQNVDLIAETSATPLNRPF